MVSETTSAGSEPQLNVTASRWRAPTQSVKLDNDGRAVRIRQRGGEVGPSDRGSEPRSEPRSGLTGQPQLTKCKLDFT